MRKTALLLGLSLSLPLAAPAVAMPLTGELLAQRVYNAEFRGYTRTGRGFENQIWHFLPDGRIRAVAEAQKLLRHNENYRQEWQDIGAWRLNGGAICVSFQGPNRILDGCYAVEARAGSQVRLVGPYLWEGTLAAAE